MSLNWTFTILITIAMPTLLNANSEPCKFYRGTIQAVTRLKDDLYIIAEDILYQLPFDGTHIDSDDRRRLHTFGARFRNRGNWARVPPLTYVSQHMEAHQSLLQLNVLPVIQHVANGEFVDPIWTVAAAVFRDGTSYNRPLEHVLVNLPNGVREEDEDNADLVQQYAMWSDGGLNVLMARRIVEKPFEYGKEVVLVADAMVKARGDSVTFPPFPTTETLRKPYYQASLNAEKSAVQFALYSRPLTGRALVSQQDQAFGFIFQGTVHYWDLPTQQVYLFKVPQWSRLPAQSAIHRVPFDRYFACSEAEWNGNFAETTTSNSGSRETVPPFNGSSITTARGTLASIQMIHIGLVALCVILLLLLVLLCICLLRSSKKRKAKRSTYKSLLNTIGRMLGRAKKGHGRPRGNRPISASAPTGAYKTTSSDDVSRDKLPKVMPWHASKFSKSASGFTSNELFGSFSAASSTKTGQRQQSRSQVKSKMPSSARPGSSRSTGSKHQSLP